jgi:poly(3-hydroxybutyrate) depolymerase
MFYQFVHTQRAIFNPLIDWCSVSAKLYRDPHSPLAYSPLASPIGAGLNVLARIHQDYAKPAFGIDFVLDGRIAVREQVAQELPFCRLLHFKRYTDDVELLQRMKQQPAVLVVAPLSGHHSTLLRDTVRQLLCDHEVYVTDWIDARLVPLEAGGFRLDDYVDYVRRFIRALGPTVHVMAVCQPAVPVLAAVALMAADGEQTPRSMTLMGGPIDARRSPTAVNKLAADRSLRWFEQHLVHRVPQNFPGRNRRVYPGFLQLTSFVAMNPDRHFSSHYEYFLNLVRGDDEGAASHRAFYDEYNAVMDMPAEYYLETVERVFQQFALARGSWRIGGVLVRPECIADTALLTIEGTLDDITGAGQTHAAQELCASVRTRARIDVEGAGHYGIFSGRRWREKVYPALRDFIRAAS